MVGVPIEDSDAVGVNGDDSNNDASASGAAYVFDLGESGCPLAMLPTLSGPPSSSAGFTVSCPSFVQTCTGAAAVIFGSCASSPITIPDGITCGECSLLVSPAWGSVGDPFVIGPGLPVGFTFCVQCGCIAGACIDLSMALEIEIVP